MLQWWWSGSECGCGCRPVRRKRKNFEPFFRGCTITTSSSMRRMFFDQIMSAAVGAHILFSLYPQLILIGNLHFPVRTHLRTHSIPSPTTPPFTLITFTTRHYDGHIPSHPQRVFRSQSMMHRHTSPHSATGPSSA